MVLGVGRAIGEAIAVMMVSGNATSRMLSLFESMRFLTTAVASEWSYSIVIVTHNMQQAVRISDQTAFFLRGKLIEFGNTEALFSQPKEKKTEDYITGRFG